MLLPLPSMLSSLSFLTAPPLSTCSLRLLETLLTLLTLFF
jgi:hypothetical protein